jgi:TPP-dependent pyruvate/acetoin dehydrogenase alpha subunit
MALAHQTDFREISTEASIKELEKQVRAEVDEAVEFAKSDKEPPLSELYTDVELPNPEYIRGTDGIYGHGKCDWARQ